MPFMVFLVKHSWVMATPQQRLLGSRIKPQSRIGRYLLYHSEKKIISMQLFLWPHLILILSMIKVSRWKHVIFFGRAEGDYWKISPDTSSLWPLLPESRLIPIPILAHSKNSSVSKRLMSKSYSSKVFFFILPLTGLLLKISTNITKNSQWIAWKKKQQKKTVMMQFI